MREEEACNSKTPTEICIEKVKGIPGNIRGTAAPKKQILAFEKMQIAMNKETKRANDAEERAHDAEERSAQLLDKVLALEEKMNNMAAKMSQLPGFESGQIVSTHFTFFILILIWGLHIQQKYGLGLLFSLKPGLIHHHYLCIYELVIYCSFLLNVHSTT